MALTEAHVNAYHRDGFTVVRGYLSPSEIAEAKQAILRVGDTGVGLILTPELQRFWNDPRAIEFAAQVLGADPVIEGDGSANVATMRQWPVVGRHLHHDAKGTLENLACRVHAPQSTTYPVARFGIYLDDHSRHSGGLKVVPGSHVIPSDRFPETMEYHNIPTEPGDLVIFCLRTLHSPFALRSKKAPEMALSCRDEDIQEAGHPHAFLPYPEQRGTIFFNYCDRSEMADINVKNRAVFQNLGAWHKHVLTSPIPLRADAAIVEAAMSGITDPNVWRRLRDWHFETSSHFPLWLKDEPPEVVSGRVLAYRKAKPMNTDVHMASLNREGHLLLRQAWQGENQTYPR